MIYLIVPPIIIVFAAAILLVFLAKVIPSNANGGSFVLKDDEEKENKPKKKKGFFRSRSETARERLQKSAKKEKKMLNEAEEKNGSLNNVTQGIVADKSAEKIVSLRKKSMVSDKIENAEGRDPEEIALMREIERDPQNSKKYEKLGDYYMEHEQFEDARECYKYVLRLDPRHKRAQVAMKNLDRVLD